MLHRVISNLPEPRDLFRRTLTQCFASNPESTSRIVLLMALYLDVSQFSRDVIGRTESMIAALIVPLLMSLSRWLRRPAA